MSMIENGIIRKAFLGFEDHGMLSFMISLDFASSSQGFGGWRLDTWCSESSVGIGTAQGCQMIISLLKTLGVNEWSHLIGTNCRVRRHNAFGPIQAIGHLIQEKWFSPSDVAKGFA